MVLYMICIDYIAMVFIIYFFIFSFFVIFIICVEVVLSKNEEMLRTMIDSGILEILVDILSSDSDPDILV